MIYGGAGGYSKQNFNIFYNNMLMSNASFVGFQDLGEGWAKDMDKVFYMGQIVSGADPFFFKVLGSGYGKDMNHVYQYGQMLPGVDAFNFQPPPSSTMMMPQPFLGTTTIHHPVSTPSLCHTSSGQSMIIPQPILTNHHHHHHPISSPSLCHGSSGHSMIIPQPILTNHLPPPIISTHHVATVPQPYPQPVYTGDCCILI